MDHAANEDDVAKLFGNGGDDDAMEDDDDVHSAIVSSRMSALAVNLQALGVEPEVAVGYASSVVTQSRRIDFIELFGQGGFIDANRMPPSINIEGLAALGILPLRNLIGNLGMSISPLIASWRLSRGSDFSRVAYLVISLQIKKVGVISERHKKVIKK